MEARNGRSDGQRNALSGPSRGEEGTQSIQRALWAMRLIASSGGRGLRLVDIASKLDLHHSTAFRILGALEHEGLVERAVGSRRYVIGSEMVWLGLGAASRFPIAAAAAPALDRLSAQVGDTVFLTVRSGNESVCADRRIGSFPIQVLSIAIGSRRPLGISQGGRAILAFLPENTAHQIMAANESRFEQYGRDPRLIIGSTKTAQATGYICSDGVTVKNTRVIAVPILDMAGVAVAAISFIAIRRRLPAARISSVVAMLKATAREIAKELPPTTAERMRRSPMPAD